MNFGESVGETAAHAQLSFAADNGVNLIDTAETYPYPPSADKHGLSETFIGNWFKHSGSRAKTCLVTKIAGPSAHLRYLRGGDLDFEKSHLITSVEESLARLQTDHIDIALLHWPFRATNTLGQMDYKPAKKERDPLNVKSDIKQTLEAIDELIVAGKVRYFGLSNETPWGVMQFLATAKEHGLPRIVTLQNRYHLLDRHFDVGLAEIADREEIGLMAYSPLAFGLLSAKHHGDTGILKNTRLDGTKKLHRFLSETSLSVAKKYVDLAASYEINPAQMAIAYLLTRRYVTTVLVSASSLDQLDINLSAPQIVLPKNLLKDIDKIHRQYPNPCL